MTKLSEIYVCEICGNRAIVDKIGAGPLVCCGQNMILLEEKREDIGKEKHKPVIIFEENKIIVKVGEIPHPMEEAHYIEFIELLKNNYIIARSQLKPYEKPEAVFYITDKNIRVRIFCNIHGLWT